MARYLFISESPVVLSAPALPDLTAEFAASAVFTVWDSRTSGTNVSANLFNVAGTALLVAVDLVTDGSGVLPGFRGPDNMTVVWIDFGGGIARAPIVSSEIVKTIADAYIAGTLGGGGSGGSVTSGNITDSTQVGRQVLTAIDATAALNAIGAMPAGFTGLQLGATSTTAAAGDHVHALAAIVGLAAALAAKIDSGSGPLVIYRVTTAGGALPIGTIPDGSICIQPNA